MGLLGGVTLNEYCNGKNKTLQVPNCQKWALRYGTNVMIKIEQHCFPIGGSGQRAQGPGVPMQGA